MSVKLSPIFNSQVVDASGNPATGWKIYTYVAGSSTPLATYTTSAGNVAQSNPIIIDSLGFPTVGQIWLTAGSTYKLVLTDANDVVKKTEDNVSGVNDSSVSIDEWIDSGVTPTYVSATSFTLVGDQTSAFHVGRRLKCTVTAGTTYSRIVSSAYGALTTVTVVNDGSLTLDSGLSAVQYGILRNNVLSIPFRIATSSGTDTYTASVGATRLVTGDEYKINIASANTSTTPTLNLDSLGAKTIKTQSGGAVVAGSLNGEHLFRYNGTDMIVLNPIAQNMLDTLRIDVASASTVDLTTNAPNTRNINITGTTSITAFTVASGLTYFVRFNASLTLTNGASLVTQTGANITTQAGDTCVLRSTAANTVEVLSYVPAKNASQPGTAPAYGARAWCVFDGTTAGTNAPTAGGNVSTVQRESTGVYLGTMSAAMPDTNFAVVVTAVTTLGAGGRTNLCSAEPISTTTFRIRAIDTSTGSAADQKLISVAVYR